MEQVILVDADDRETGTMEKMEAHEKGLLHRAFSVVLFNKEGQMLLQQRAAHKYHSGGLWTNTCCSHPRPGETIAAAATRRLREEMGISVPLTFAFKFTYQAQLENNLIEHECDHVLVGRFDGSPSPDPAEVSGWQFESVDAIRERMIAEPGRYTYWFKLLMNHPLFTDTLGR